MYTLNKADEDRGSDPREDWEDIARTAESGTIIRAKSPLRLSFVGGGTDLPHWYEAHDGAVLSTTINRYAYVTLYPREDSQVKIRSVDLGYTVKYDMEEGPVFDGVLDLAKATIRRLGATKGMNLDVRSDAPAGSGLGGSSALTAAVIGAVAVYTGKTLDKYDLAELNFVIERQDLAIAGGKQDQYATTFGGFNHIEFLKDRVVVNPLRLDRGIANDLEAHLLLCYTGGVRADLGLVEKQVSNYREGRQTTIDAMHRLQEMVVEMKEALFRGRLDRFGEGLHEALVNKRRMNPDVTKGTIVDKLYERALEQGATGGKLLGAGGGGYLLLYCKTDRQHDVRRALEELGGTFTDFAFDGRGLQTWRSRSL